LPLAPVPDLGGIGRVVLGLGLDRLARAVFGGPGVILMFHSVGPAPKGAWRASDGLTVTPEFLSSVINMLRAENYRIIPIHELLPRLAKGEKGLAVLTFDDGYRNNLTEAKPVLEALQAPATVYVTSGFIDRTSGPWWYPLERAIAGANAVKLPLGGETRSWPTVTAAEKTKAFNDIVDEMAGLRAAARDGAIKALAAAAGIDFAADIDRRMLSWDEVVKLGRSGRVEIGAHTVTHPTLARLEEEEARAEMAQGRAALERALDKKIKHFAYPFGDGAANGAREERLAAALGFDTAVTTRRGPLASDSLLRPHGLRRIGLGFGDRRGDLRLRMTGVAAAARRLLNGADAD